jgi:glycine oxidase
MRTFDVAIAGGGLIGGAIALELVRAGLRVGLFDRQEPGKEASWASAGIISPAPESPAMIPLVPLGKASAALHPAFSELVQELSGQPVGFRPKGTLEAIFSKSARQELNTIIALHHGLGLKAEPLSAAEARELEPALSESLEAGVLRPEEASVDNRALTKAVFAAARKSGAEISSGARVDAVLREGGRCVGLVVNGEKLEAGKTVIAAGCFSESIDGVAPYAPVRPAKGQVVSFRCDSVRIERVLWSEKTYLVPRNDGRILAGATLEHVGFDKKVTLAGLSKLSTAAIEVVPGLKDACLEEAWAGLRPDTPDHLPILGPVDVEGLLFATGHYRSGILLAPVTAKLICEWVTQNTTSLDCARFSPMRFQRAGSSATSRSVASS